MTRSTIMRSGKTVTAVIQGAYHQYVCKDEETAVEMVKDALAIRENGTEDELIEFFLPTYRVSETKGVQRTRSGKFFLEGTNTELPALLVQRIKDHAECGLPTDPLINFWKLTLTNPNLDVRKDLFAFADRFQFPITSKGYFIAYKSVAWIGERHKDFGLEASKKFVEIVAAGKNPDDTVVVEYGMDKDTTKVYYFKADEFVKSRTDLGVSYYEDYYDLEKWLVDNHWKDWSLWLNVHQDASKEEIADFAKSLGWKEPDKEAWGLNFINFQEHGTVKSVFEGISQLFEVDEPMFTDWHTRRMDIRLGVPVKMDMKDCDTDRNNTCSSGLHVGAPGYVKGFYGGNDRYIIACLVNPADVAAVPVDYSFEKMRTSQYYPYAVCDIDDEGNLKEIDTKFFEEDYVAHEAADIEHKLEELKASIASLSDEDEVKASVDLEALLSSRLVLLNNSESF